jgi:hypothetical protein
MATELEAIPNAEQWVEKIVSWLKERETSNEMVYRDVIYFTACSHPRMWEEVLDPISKDLKSALGLKVTASKHPFFYLLLTANRVEAPTQFSEPKPQTVVQLGKGKINICSLCALSEIAQV